MQIYLELKRSTHFWYVFSLPSHPLRSACTSPQDEAACTLHAQPRCNFLAGNSRPQTARARSLNSVQADCQCSPGEPSGQTTSGEQLVIGLKELIYNKVYDSCIPDATADYRLPDLSHRQPDSTICAADPFNTTVRRHQMLIMTPSFHLQLACVGQHVWICHADYP